MKILSVHDKEFAAYGKVQIGYDTADLHAALAALPCPDGVEYVPAEPSLACLPIAAQLAANGYGGMPIQLGYCNGHNTKLNCLEYHRDSEINFGTEDFILLLAKEDEIENGMLDTAKIKAFLCPADVVLEVYATTLHYAPCSAKKGAGFRVMVVLPKSTNTEKPAFTPLNDEDKRLWARNKWLLAHKDTTEAAQGAYIGLAGENIDISNFI
ncbi:MAG: DUF4867 family protein [Ruthenibacterium sp.]